jgi:hypothetical protein
VNIRAALLRAEFQERIDARHVAVLDGFPDGTVRLVVV